MYTKDQNFMTQCVIKISYKIFFDFFKNSTFDGLKENGEFQIISNKCYHLQGNDLFSIYQVILHVL